MKNFSTFLLGFVFAVLLLGILTTPVALAEEPCGDPSCAGTTSNKSPTEAASTVPTGPSTCTDRICDEQLTPRLLPGSPGVSGSADFEPLAGLPGITSSKEDRTLADYVNALFRLAIGIAALLAVIKITVAGIKYMTSDAFSSKESAKKDITSSLLGLLIILSTVVILQLIYPGILNLNALKELPTLESLIFQPIETPYVSDGQFNIPGSRDNPDYIEISSSKELCEKVEGGKYMREGPRSSFICVHDSEYNFATLIEYKESNATDDEKLLITKIQNNSIETDSDAYRDALQKTQVENLLFTVSDTFWETTINQEEQSALQKLCEESLGGGAFFPLGTTNNYICTK